MKLTDLIDKKTGLPKRGAVSRLAEMLGITYNWTRKIILGEYTPSRETFDRLRYILATKTPGDFRERKTGRPAQKPITINHA